MSMDETMIIESAITNTRLFQYAKKETTPYRLFIQKIKYDWSFVHAGMLAFNLLIALLPMAISFFGVFALILENYPDLRNRFRDKIIQAFPPKANDGVREILNMALKKLYEDAGFILALGIFLSILGSSRLFVAIDRCLTIIYRVPERKFLKKYLVALGMLFLILTLIPLMILASSLPTFVLRFIPNSPGRYLAFLVGFLVNFSFSFILFELIYIIIPNRKMSFNKTWCGSVLAASLLELSMIVFPLYIEYLLASYTGQIGFAVILIFFLFYSAIILVLGAQINAFFFEHIQPLPVSLGSFVSTIADQSKPQSESLLKSINP